MFHTQTVEKAFPNKWFTGKLGQIIVSDKKLDHWFGAEILVKLT